MSLPLSPPAAAVQLPWISNGAWDLHHATPSEADATSLWLQLGGRGLDTAYSYGSADQIGVGDAVRKAAPTIPRGDIFVTTKIPCAGNASGALAYVKEDLAQLGLAYADLILIHTPAKCTSDAEIQATWQGLEHALALNLTRAIGVSNFEVVHLNAVLAAAKVMPAVNQCCLRVGFHDDDAIALCKQKGIVYQGYSPLGHGTNTSAPPVLLLPEVKAIAAAHNVSAAQVAFRFLTQQGHPLVTATGTKEYDLEDLNSLAFNMTAAELATLTQIKAEKCWS